MPSIVKTPNEASNAELCKRCAVSVREVVVTLTLNVAGTVALILWVAGMAQMTPKGAPVQLIEAVPAAPDPPIERV